MRRTPSIPVTASFLVALSGIFFVVGVYLGMVIGAALR
jgi:hypothetical protein